MNFLEPFVKMAVSCVIYSTMNRQKRNETTRMTTVKKLINQNVRFKTSAKLNWHPMKLLENRRCP